MELVLLGSICAARILRLTCRLGVINCLAISLSPWQKDSRKRPRRHAAGATKVGQRTPIGPTQVKAQGGSARNYKSRNPTHLQADHLPKTARFQLQT
jgi:hypothetical protein